MPVIYVQNESAGLLPQRLRYVLDILEQHPLAPPDVHFEMQKTSAADFTVVYGGATNQAADCITVEGSGKFLLEKKLEEYRPADFQNWKKRIFSFDEKALYGLDFGKKSGVGETPFFKDGKIEMDIFANLFFHLSRMEEWICTVDQLDAHERMQAGKQFLARENIAHQPVVDQIVSAFYECLDFAPQRRPTVISLTHDIDLIQKFKGFGNFVRQAFGLFYHQKNPTQLARFKFQFFKTRLSGKADPFDTFHWLLADERVRERVIYFLAGGSRAKVENHFSIKSPEARRVIELAKERGYVIGLHPSYDAHTDGQLFEKQKQTLEEVAQTTIRHSRQHYLRWKFPETPDLIEKSGIAYDSTLGFADRIGFRCGTGFDYPLYNFKEERPYRFLEKPLVLMDVAWLREVLPEFPQRRLSGEQMDQAARKLEDFLSANEWNTAICTNFHNSVFDSVNLDADWLKKIYLEKIVRAGNK